MDSFIKKKKDNCTGMKNAEIILLFVSVEYVAS